MILRSGLLSKLLTRFLSLSCIALIYSSGALAGPSLLHTGGSDSSSLQQKPAIGPQQPLTYRKEALAADHASVQDTQDSLDTSEASYDAALDALKIMQSHFFEVSHGAWPDAIDWTAAVMGTQVSATLAVMSRYHALERRKPEALGAYERENLINRYFTQIAAFYFGENAFSVRYQAYDDMLWVVLGWLESIKFITHHSSLHYAQPSTIPSEYNGSNWYGRQFVPQFAHRARLFYDLASRGWDNTLCGGGMLWNPYLAPYKNAITNQLFITASVGMYLYFPGDSNPSPFEISVMGNMPPAKAHDKRYLRNAIEGYKWLTESGMRNEKGLYTDGFHIRGWRGGDSGSNGTGKCDLRDEKVYTYNQGVLLSGLRALWEATGSGIYLEDGHDLIRSVIAATGWEARDGPQRWRWAGLGRAGIMEEVCDWSGTCSQDAQTFKGIFFHHFTVFCSPLPVKENDEDRPWLGDDDSHILHRQSCDQYAGWVARNAKAAFVTKDQNGEYGQWWGRAARSASDEDSIDHGHEKEMFERPSDEGTDYRNDGIPRDEVWRRHKDDDSYEQLMSTDIWQDPRVERCSRLDKSPDQKDINDRGRGRTVETQSGGLAVIRAAWKMLYMNADTQY